MVLFLEHELQKLFSKEHDSFIKVKQRNVTWFNTWVKWIIQWKIKPMDHSLSLTGMEELLSPPIISFDNLETSSLLLKVFLSLFFFFMCVIELDHLPSFLPAFGLEGR